MNEFTERLQRDHQFVARRIGDGLHPVAAWRERREISREELAERADLTPREVASIEDGLLVPDTSQRGRLAQALATDAEALIP
ncbi:helix-turn-helix domain-containing protein [Frigidibacter sp. MR17.24]|uniref:helix-turn-helix domain-containing protein n=1 Tax=Frigidibacter sp. MR17.24 TaxID=3127345 RepID=UPI0030131041